MRLRPIDVRGNVKREVEGGDDRTKARGRLKLIEQDVTGRDGKPLLCDVCEGPLDAYDFLQEAEKARTVVCCRKPSCSASAKKTAEIYRLNLEPASLQGARPTKDK